MRFGLLLFSFSLILFAQDSTSTPEKGVVAGKVLNSVTGEPVRKAHVGLLDLNVKRGGGAVTDAAGHFEISALAAGSYLLVAAREGFVTPDRRSGLEVALASGEERHDVVIRLTPLGVISGRILDEDGDPIRRVVVRTMAYEYSASGRQLSPRGGTSTNDLGEYRIFDLTPGPYYLKTDPETMTSRGDESFAPSYYPGTPDAAGAAAIEVGAGQHVQGIDLTLHRTQLARVRGRVMNPGDNLMVGLTTLHGGTGSSSVDDPKGKFELEGVAPGAYTLIADDTVSGKHCSAHLPIQVGSADLEGIELHLLPPMEVAGQMRIEGKTTAKLSRLSVLLQDEGRIEQSMTGGETKEDGSFVIAGLEPGVYQVSVSGSEDLYLKAVRWSDRDVMQSGLDLTQGVAGGGLAVVLSANGGQIDGVVEDDQSAPVIGAMVALVPADARRMKALFKMDQTSRSSHFRMKGIAPGSYKLFAWEDADPNRVLYDPDFLKPFDSQGKSIEISEGSKESVQLKLIKQ